MPGTKEATQAVKEYLLKMKNKDGIYIPLTPIIKFIYRKFKQWRRNGKYKT